VSMDRIVLQQAGSLRLVQLAHDLRWGVSVVLHQKYSSFSAPDLYGESQAAVKKSWG
jgi:hypothetical protein